MNRTLKLVNGKEPKDIVYKTIRNCLIFGCDINYGRLSLSFVPNYLPRRIFSERKYQVNFEGYGQNISELYVNLDDAIDKFLGIKEVIDERNRLKEANRKLQTVSPESEDREGRDTVLRSGV